MKIYKTLRKRGLAMFMALIMCLSLIPTTAFAAEETDHVHNEDGWVCTQAEPTTELVCGKHVHNEDCYQDVQGGLTCAAVEHQHSESCYAAAEPVLDCGQAEHAHGDGCYDEEGNLVCETRAHTHDSGCYTEGEPVLVCEIPEHTHDGDCYAVETVKVCGAEDHEHGDECYTVTEGEWTCVPPEETGEEMPAIEASETFADQGITVEVSAPEGAFPVGTTVSIVPVPEIPMAFDITFVDEDGMELQPANGLSVDVNFSIPNPVVEMGFASAELEIVHITDEEAWEGETLHTQEITADDGDTVDISVAVESFSIYAAKVTKARAGGDSYGTNGAAVLAALKELRSDNVTRSAYESFYPETNTYNVCWGWDAEDGYGAVELDKENETATDVVWTTYYDSHYLGEPKGYKWITSHSSNPSVATATAKQVQVGDKQALEVTITRGSGSGRAIIEIGFTVTEMKVLAGIAWDYQTFSDTNGYLYYIVDNEGETVEPEVPTLSGNNQVHEVYMPVDDTVEISRIITAGKYWTGGVIGSVYGYDQSLPAGTYSTAFVPGTTSATAPDPEIATATFTAEGDRSEGYCAKIKAGQQTGTTVITFQYDGRIVISAFDKLWRSEYGWNDVKDQFIVHVYDPETVTIPVGTMKEFQYPETPLNGFDTGLLSGATGTSSVSTPCLSKNPTISNSTDFTLQNNTNIESGKIDLAVKADATANKSGTVTAAAEYVTKKDITIGKYSQTTYTYASRTIYSYKVNVKSIDSNKYNLTFDKNTTNTVNQMPSDNPVTGNFNEGQTEVTLKLPTDVPTRSGYTFQGWDTDKGVSKGRYEPGDDFTIEKTDPNVTLYAIWSKNPDDKPMDEQIQDALKNAKVIVSCGTDSNHEHDPANSKTLESDLLENTYSTPVEYYNEDAGVYSLFYTVQYEQYGTAYETFVQQNGGPAGLTHRLVNPATNTTSVLRITFLKKDGAWALDSTHNAYFAVTCGTVDVGKVTVTKVRLTSGTELDLTKAQTIEYMITVTNATESVWTGSLSGGIFESGDSPVTKRVVKLSPVADNKGRQITLTNGTTSQFTVLAGGTVTLYVSYTADDSDMNKTLWNKVSSTNPSENVVIVNADSGIKIVKKADYTVQWIDVANNTAFRNVTRIGNVGSTVSVADADKSYAGYTYAGDNHKGTVLSAPLAASGTVLKMFFTQNSGQPAPNLEITKSAPKGVSVGGDVKYTITVKNTGNADATNVVVRDTLPEELAGYITKSTPSYSRDRNGVYSWDLETIEPGESKTITFTAPTSRTGIAKNKAQVTSQEITDPKGSNEVETRIFKLTPTKSHDQNVVVNAENGTATVTYTVTIKNESGFDLYGLDIIDTLKAPTIASGTAAMQLVPQSVATTDSVATEQPERKFALSCAEDTKHVFPALSRNTVFKDGSTVTLTYDVVITRTSTDAQLVLTLNNTAYGGCWTAEAPATPDAPQGQADNAPVLYLMRAAVRSDDYDVSSGEVSDSYGQGDQTTIIIPLPEGKTTVNWVVPGETPETIKTEQVPNTKITGTTDDPVVPKTYYPTDKVPNDGGKWGDPVKQQDGSITITWIPKSAPETVTVTIKYMDNGGELIGTPVEAAAPEKDGSYDVTARITAPSGYAVIRVSPVGDPAAGTADRDKTVIVLCGEDKYGPTNPDNNDLTKKDESDGIPDKYQAVVTYMVEGGAWDDKGDKADCEYVFTLREKDTNGAWVELTDEKAPKLGNTVPSDASTTPDSDHIAAGKGWRNPVPTAATVVTGDADYIYSFPSKTDFTVTFVDDVDKAEIRKDTVTVFPDSNEYPEPPEHDRYRFDHWSTPVSNGNGNYTVTALYVKQITVTWVDENGNTVGGPIIIDENSDYSERYPAKPEGPGHWGDPVKDANGDIKIQWIPENVDPTVRTITVNRVDESGRILSSVAVPNVPVADTRFTLTEAQAPSSLDDSGNRYIRTDSLGTVPIPENGIINVRYALDNWDVNGGSLSSGDGIPDSRQVVVNYRSNDTDYGTVADGRQMFTLAEGQTSVTLRNTASTTALSRTYFIDWTQGSSVLDRDEALRTDFSVAGGRTYTVIANFGRRAAGGGTSGGTGGGTTTTPPTTIPDTAAPLDPGDTISDQEVPLAGTVGLNNTDHFAYVIGYPDDTVHPLANITRAEAATIFFRLMTEEYRSANWSTSNDFSDVKAGDWYNNAISTCARAGVVKGYEDGTFRPNAPITRAEFAAMAAGFMDTSITDEGVGDFSDTADHWAASAIRRAAKAGWVTGDGNRFRPNDNITRAEVMTIVNRMLDRTPDKDHMLSDMKKWIDNPEDAWYYEAVQEATNEHDYERDEAAVETWTLIKEHRDWAALELGWAANNGASAPAAETETETQSLPDGI